MEEAKVFCWPKYKHRIIIHRKQIDEATKSAAASNFS